MPQANSTTSSPRATSPAASAATLPCSCGDQRGQLGWRGRGPARGTRTDRGAPGQRDAAPARANASLAAATARSTSAGAGEVDAAGDLPGGRVVDVAVPLGLAVPGLAADPVGECCLLSLARAPSPCFTASALTAVRASARRPRPSLASASLRVSGGAIRSVCPYRPPLPISRPRSLVASSIRAASGGLGAPVAGSTRSTANIRPLPRTSPTAASGRPPRAGPLMIMLAGHGRVALQVVGEHVVEGGVGRGGGERVAAEGGDAVAADAVQQVAAGDHAADGEAVAQALGERHDVRDDPVRADAPEVLAGAAPAGLHLVGDEQDAVLVEDRGVRAEQPVGRHGEPADALHRLGDQAGDVGRVDAAVSRCRRSWTQAAM